MHSYHKLKFGFITQYTLHRLRLQKVGETEVEWKQYAGLCFSEVLEKLVGTTCTWHFFFFAVAALHTNLEPEESTNNGKQLRSNMTIDATR